MKREEELMDNFCPVNVSSDAERSKGRPTILQKHDLSGVRFAKYGLLFTCE